MKEKKCNDCLYYWEENIPHFRQTTVDNPQVIKQTDSRCKNHNKRFYSEGNWHPVNPECFSVKE